MQPLWFAPYPAQLALETFTRGLADEYFPGFLMFGSNGGGEYVAFDARGSAPSPLVYIDMVNIDLDESVELIAPSFEAFLELVGAPGPH